MSGKTNFPQTWLAIMLAAITLLALNAGQSYRALQELIDNENRANTTKSILRTIKDFYASIQDAELGARGYFLTHDRTYLKPYFDSMVTIKFQLLLLKGYEYQEQRQLQQVLLLESLLISHLSDIDNYIEERKLQTAQDNPPPPMTAKILFSYQWFQQFRAVINDLETDQYNLLEEQSQEAKSSRERVFYTLVVATIVGFSLVLLVGLLVHRAIRYQQQETRRLETMVEERTRELSHFSNELQRSNRELQDFAFVASHDLQEPLRKIRTFGDRLINDYADRLGDGADYVTRMQNAALRMSGLISALLEYSRVSTSTSPFEPVDLGVALEDVLDTLELKIGETGARIHSDPLPIIDADGFQMRQLLQNLLLNAIKFTPEDTTPEIHISCSPAGCGEQPEAFRLAFTDNGIGIDPSFAEKIFTPFQRLHRRDQYEGTGIGLAICRRIVARHGGHIEVARNQGQGSTFLVTLPATQKPLTT